MVGRVGMMLVTADHRDMGAWRPPAATHRAHRRATVKGGGGTHFWKFFGQVPNGGELPPWRDVRARRSMAVDPGVPWLGRVRWGPTLPRTVGVATASTEGAPRGKRGMAYHYRGLARPRGTSGRGPPWAWVVHHMGWPADMQCRWERHRASPQAACEPKDRPPNPNPTPLPPPLPPQQTPHCPPPPPPHLRSRRGGAISCDMRTKVRGRALDSQIFGQHCSQALHDKWARKMLDPADPRCCSCIIWFSTHATTCMHRTRACMHQQPTRIRDSALIPHFSGCFCARHPK